MLRSAIAKVAKNYSTQHDSVYACSSILTAEDDLKSHMIPIFNVC